MTAKQYDYSFCTEASLLTWLLTMHTIIVLLKLRSISMLVRRSIEIVDDCYFPYLAPDELLLPLESGL